MARLLDLISIGIDATQSYQLYKAQEDLKNIEVGVQTAIQVAAARQAILGEVRNFVFRIAQDINGLEEYIETTPQQVYVAAHALEWRLQDSGVDPEMFTEFADKEYIQQTFTHIRQIIQKSQVKLSPPELEQADTAVKYIQHIGLLDTAIRAKTTQEELASVDAQLTHVGTLVGKKSPKRLIMGFIGLVFACVMPDELGVFGTLLAVALVIGSLVLMLRPDPEQKQIQSRQQSLQKRRAELEKQILPRGELRPIIQLWGEQSSRAYREIQQQQINLLREMFGQVEGLDKFLPRSR